MLPEWHNATFNTIKQTLPSDLKAVGQSSCGFKSNFQNNLKQYLVMKTNVIVQNTVPSAILKKVKGTLWIRPVNASLYTINEHGRMHRLSLYLNRVNYRESNLSGQNAFEDLFLNGLKEKMYSEGSPISSYSQLVQSLKEDAINLLKKNPDSYYQRYPAEVGTYKPFEFYESQSVAEFMKEIFLAAAKSYDSSLEIETSINPKYLAYTSNNGNFEDKNKISQFLLKAAEACRIYTNFPDASSPHYFKPTVVQGNIDPNMNELIPYMASIFDRISSSL